MNIRCRIRTSLAIALLGLLVACISPPAQAHPMGNFAICHYSRIAAGKEGLRLRYILDMAEIPTLEEKQKADRNEDGSVDSKEQTAYLTVKARDLVAGLSLALDGSPAQIQIATRSMRFSPGA